jgi:3-deoxy-D-manno-octulosonic-acid transferase
VHVVLTTKSAEAIGLLSVSLPARVIVQDVPLESYGGMAAFLAHFRPQACILMVRGWLMLAQGVHAHVHVCVCVCVCVCVRVCV